MISWEERVKLLQSESQSFQRYLSQLPEDDWTKQSACDLWSVGDVVAHLVGNAGDFVPTSDGKIEIGAISQSKFVIFSVRDNGIGITTEKQEKLFHEFYQVDVVNQEKHSGSGLGLAICKGLIKKMKGRIWLESKQGEGTTIYFCLPREEA